MITGRPKLTLIGALGLIAGTSLLGGCDDDTAVAVERASYATQANCEQDWSRSGDCVFVPDAAQPASSASEADRAGAHGAVGHWYGPYYTRSGTVYHSDGTQTRESVTTRNAMATTSENVPSRALSHGGGGEISRGGFGESAHGGGEGGHGGGHGG